MEEGIKVEILENIHASIDWVGKIKLIIVCLDVLAGNYHKYQVLTYIVGHSTIVV
jgi:hypothetical protein